MGIAQNKISKLNITKVPVYRTRSLQDRIGTFVV